MRLNWELHRLFFNLRVWPIRRKQAKHLQALQTKERIKIVFFATNLSMWKYQDLYEELCKYSCFVCYIVLSPAYHVSMEQKVHDVHLLRDYFKSKRIPFLDYKLQDDQGYDVKVKIDPDILFYPQPYASFLSPLHHSSHFEDKLLCYYPYAFWTGKDGWSYNNRFQNLAWKLFYSTELNRQDAIRYSFRKDKNVEVVGYPDTDTFLAYKNKGQEIWKKQSKPKKRLIWAPHFSIPDMQNQLIQISNFLWMADLMLEVAERYRDDLQIAFKPHPLLISRLYMHPDWGKKKTDAYYQKWAEMENTQLEELGFVNLFMTSDAMIHDCGSFMVEYHYSQNPVMYVLCDEKDRISTLNELGLQAFNAHYKGHDRAEVLHFIEQVVLAGKDPMRPQRVAFYQAHLLPSHGMSVAQATVDILLNELNKHH